MIKIKEHLNYLLIISCFFVYISEGVLFNPFAFWNMTPLLISYFVFKAALKNQSISISYSSIGFGIGCLLIIVFFHLAWLFDWGETKTGSSTSGLIFIFIPIIAIISGVIFSVLGLIWGKLLKRDA